MQEIHQTQEDFSSPYRFYLVLLESGTPTTRAFDVLSLAKWSPEQNTEIVAVYENPENSRILQKSLEEGKAIFLDQDASPK